MNKTKVRFDPSQGVDETVIHAILESPAIVLPGLPVDVQQERTHDDHDGNWDGSISLSQDRMGDMWFLLDRADSMNRTLRFRNCIGGTNSPRVHNALKILAEAIRLDNIDRPEPSKRQSK